MRRESKFVLCILAAWLCFALALALSGRFETFSAPAVAGTVWGMTALGLLACWLMQAGRDWLAIVDLRWLIALHLTRFVGFYFLLLGRRGQLPQAFATPAGIGDIIVASLAAFVLVVPSLRHRMVLLVWNSLGLIDILFVVSAALRFGLREWTSMAALRQLPLSLLPTFLVPLIIISHVLIFVRLRRH